MYVHTAPIVPEYGISGQRNPYYHKSMPEILDTMTCPLEKILLILGPKGTTMKQIIDISGADIIVNHDLPPSVPRILELRGTETQVFI